MHNNLILPHKLEPHLLGKLNRIIHNCRFYPNDSTEDIEAFKLSLKDIIRVHGKVSHLAKEAHLSRGTLYKLMQGKGQTEIGTILKLIHALGYDLTVTRRAQTV